MALQTHFSTARYLMSLPSPEVVRVARVNRRVIGLGDVAQEIIPAFVAASEVV